MARISRPSQGVLVMKQLIAAVAQQKTVDSTRTQFIIDSNCVLEAMLTAMTPEQIDSAIKDHGLKGPSYKSAVNDLRKVAMMRKNQPR